MNTNTNVSFVQVVQDGSRFRWRYQKHSGQATTSDVTYCCGHCAMEAAQKVAECYGVPFNDPSDELTPDEAQALGLTDEHYRAALATAPAWTYNGNDEPGADINRQPWLW